MKRTVFLGLFSAALLATAVTVRADNATMHGSNLTRKNGTVQITKFDVTLDGRLLTADRSVYHPDSGIVELSGNVKLHFHPHVRQDVRIK